MNRITQSALWTLAFCLTFASVAGAAPTPETKCTAAKLDAQRKRSFCVAGAKRTEILGKTANLAKCTTTFDKQIAAADKAAAKKGTSCRWLDNTDGTATDLNSGLQWELKNDNGPGDVHDKDNRYTWNTPPDGTARDGTVFTAFLGALNGAVSADGSTTTGCFAGHCDWRLPTIEELRGILYAQYPGCTINPCTTIPEFTAPFLYLSSSTVSPDPDVVWGVYFSDGFVTFEAGGNRDFARAVRGGG